MTLALGLFLALATAGDEEVSVRLTVSNFYRTADGKLWSSGSWEMSTGGKGRVAQARMVLEPQAKDGARRDRKGEISAKEFTLQLGELKRKGLFTAKNSAPCLCDAPQFKMVAKEGKVEHAFTFGHGHGDHDQMQKALVDAFIALIESHVTERD